MYERLGGSYSKVSAKERLRLMMAAFERDDMEEAKGTSLDRASQSHDADQSQTSKAFGGYMDQTYGKQPDDDNCGDDDDD